MSAAVDSLRAQMHSGSRIMASVEPADLAEASRELFYRLTTGRVPEVPYPDASATVREKWELVSENLMQHCAEQIECRWITLVNRCIALYYNDEGGNLSEMPNILLLVWEAVVRNAVNLITCEEDEDRGQLVRHEDFWPQWVTERMHNARHSDGDETAETAEDD